MAKLIDNNAASPLVGEHLEAVISGRLRKALLLTFVILAVELTGAVLSHSLALFSDAGLVTTDILALGLAWFAVEQTKRPADDKRSFGYHRAGILLQSFSSVVPQLRTRVRARLPQSGLRSQAGDRQ